MVGLLAINLTVSEIWYGALRCHIYSSMGLRFMAIFFTTGWPDSIAVRLTAYVLIKF